MKLLEALETANECGLETVEEAVRNIELHASSFFDYSELDEEMKELYEEADKYDPNTNVLELIEELSCETQQ